jgi:cytochrome-b5 reductase
MTSSDARAVPFDVEDTRGCPGAKLPQSPGLARILVISGFTFLLGIGLGWVFHGCPETPDAASQNPNRPVVAPSNPNIKPFTLQSKWPESPDSCYLRFHAPGYAKVEGVKLALDTPSEKEKTKSYSPISPRTATDYFDLLVKSYPYRQGGGFGNFLCNLEKGDVATMTLKKPREIHGSSQITQRWRAIGMVAGGTGLAPFVQIIRTCLEDPDDKTQLSLLFINRHEEDILMRTVLDALAAVSPRFSVVYSLTRPPEDWEGNTGRGTVELAKKALPSAEGDVMVLVCGTDGFVETWAGAKLRENGKKLQGPVAGILAEAGFTKDNVYKY